MKQIDVKNQVRLSMSKCIELVMSGIRFRLFRAAITVLIIALAATFLMTMLGESILSREVGRVIAQRTSPRRNFLFWADRLASPMGGPQLSELLAEAQPGGPRWKEFLAWGGLDEQQLASLQALTQQQRQYMDYFDRLEPGERRPLIESARGAEIFEYLRDEQQFARFREELKSVPKRLPGGPDQFQAFLQEWQASRPQRQAILAGHAAVVERFAPQLGERASRDVLAGGGAELRGALLELGYEVSQAEFDAVVHEARLARDAARIAPLVSVARFKKALAQEAGVPVQEADSVVLSTRLAKKDGPAWLIGLVEQLRRESAQLVERKAQQRQTEAEIRRLRQTDEDRERLAVLEKDLVPLRGDEENLIVPGTRALLTGMDLSEERIREVAAYEQTQRSLAGVETKVAQTSGMEKGFLGFSARAMWLLVVSFVVCVVGIANAMLMSVTERFREIATMKCLGATDGFIMVNFIMESIMQGVAGGVIGTVLGFLLGLLRAWARYGQIVVENFPFAEVALVAVLALGISVMVSAMAAVYPAYVAARLAPMEAMRIE